MDTFDILKQLADTHSPSGYEYRIAKTVESVWQPYVDELTHNTLGSVVAIKKGQGNAPRKQILLAVHMDEIGLIVSDVVRKGASGFLRVHPVGGIDFRHCYGQQLVVHSASGDIPAIFGALPDSYHETSGLPYRTDQMFVDTGLPYDSLKEQVSIGDFISFVQPVQKLQGNRVAGKALDNRSSITAVTRCLHILQSRQHSWDVVAVATVQEETRLLGAFTTAYDLMPDIAVAIDVTFGTGPSANTDNTFELGSGPVLDIGPNVHPFIHDAFKKTAKELEMKISHGTHIRASGTDAYGLQVARIGVPTAVIGLPLRYMHTPVESLDLQDIDRIGRLLAQMITNLDETFLEQMNAKMMEA